MKNNKFWTWLIIILLTVISVYMGHQKSRHAGGSGQSPVFAYILKTDLTSQLVNFLLPFPAGSKQESIFVDASQTETIQKIAPAAIDYIVRQKEDDYTARTFKKKNLSLVLGDGEISFWNQYEGIKAPPEIDLNEILAFSFTPEGIARALKDPLVGDTLRKIKIQNSENTLQDNQPDVIIPENQNPQNNKSGPPVSYRSLAPQGFHRK